MPIEMACNGHMRRVRAFWIPNSTQETVEPAVAKFMADDAI